MPEVLRQRQDAELALSNAIAHISEACTVLRQYMPEDDDEAERDPAYSWRHQIKKLRMAIGIVSNVRDLVTNDRAFAVLQPAGGGE